MKRKLIVFVLVSLVSLAAGCVAAQFLWHQVYFLHGQPSSGWYYGVVNGQFYNVEPFFSLRFRGETVPQWYWKRPTDFAYRRLDITWEVKSSKGSAMLMLPSFVYISSGHDGILTRDILALWLLGESHSTASDVALREVDFVFHFLEAAANGSLPPYRHHTYFFEQPEQPEQPIFFSHMAHYCCGFGVGGFVYIWIAIWLLAVAAVGKRLFGTYKRN